MASELRECPSCHMAHEQPVAQCARCGLIFAKWRGPNPAPPQPVQPFHEQDASPQRAPLLAGEGWRAYLWGMPEAQDALEFRVRVVVWGILVLWGLYFMSLEITPVHFNHLEGDVASAAIFGSFLHNVDLIFHEAGHLIFAPLGRFMSILGGSLMQLLMPLVCFGTFLFRYKNSFGAAVAMWWTGQSMLDLAPYIYDARPRVLMLLGGGNGRELQTMDGGTPHDWYNILSELGWLAKDQLIARGVWVLGCALIVASMVWAGMLLWRMRQTVTRPTF